MEWYEIIIGTVIFIIGIYIGIKVKDINKNKYHNDSWKVRKK